MQGGSQHLCTGFSLFKHMQSNPWQIFNVFHDKSRKVAMEMGRVSMNSNLAKKAGDVQLNVLCKQKIKTRGSTMKLSAQLLAQIGSICAQDWFDIKHPNVGNGINKDLRIMELDGKNVQGKSWFWQGTSSRVQSAAWKRRDISPTWMVGWKVWVLNTKAHIYEVLEESQLFKAEFGPYVGPVESEP